MTIYGMSLRPDLRQDNLAPFVLASLSISLRFRLVKDMIVWKSGISYRL
ncbi:hypothetical protein [Xenorhabdus bharatensis]